MAYKTVYRNRYKIEREINLLRDRYNFVKLVSKDILQGRVHFKATIISASNVHYTFEIRYSITSAPKVKILSPNIEQNSKIHMFEDSTLCLFDYRQQPWNSSMSLAEHTVPWTIEWIANYEYWKQTGLWFSKEAIH